MREAALRFPLLRQGGVSKEFMGSKQVKSDLYGNPLAESDVNISRIRANFNLPVYSKGRNVIGASVGLVQQRIELNNTKSFNSEFPVNDQVIDKTTINLAAFFSTTMNVFNKPLTLSANVAGLTDQMFSTFRLNFIGVATMGLKRTATTAYSVGLIVLADPSSPVPIFPYFNYWHKFDNNVELFFELPTRLALRKQLTKRAALSLGSELSGTTAFLNLKDSSLPQKNLFATLDLKTGPGFEYLVSKSIILGVSGGLFSTVNSRIYERSAKSDDYFISNKMGTTPYINFSISILPFLRSLY